MNYLDVKMNKKIHLDKSLLPYPARFIADPFIRNINNQLLIFAEVLVQNSDKRFVLFEFDGEWR